jgi:hypothetical protein
LHELGLLPGRGDGVFVRISEAIAPAILEEAQAVLKDMSDLIGTGLFDDVPEDELADQATDSLVDFLTEAIARLDARLRAFINEAFPGAPGSADFDNAVEDLILAAADRLGVTYEGLTAQSSETPIDTE